MFQCQRSVVNGHFSVVLSRYRITGLICPIFKHCGPVKQLLVLR
ncbi:MAG: hypothetical protein JWP21_1015, partial [Tardiphaga sp.]|nr:hypothetical protein [Tardiphaga sp.]